MRTRLGVAFLYLLSLAACFVDVPDPDANAFACETDDQCASGYICFTPANATQGLCKVSCSENGDCPGEAPSCTNGVCLTTTEGLCGALKCGESHQVCVIDGSTASCKNCRDNNSNCNDPSLDCVVDDTNNNSGKCVPVDRCSGSSIAIGDVCQMPDGKQGKCAKVKRPNNTVGMVCAPCPCNDPSKCTASAADTYGGATSCGGSNCSTTSEVCSDQTYSCVRNTTPNDAVCVPKCAPLGDPCTADGGATGVCVSVTSGKGTGPMMVCAACPTGCSTSCIDSNIGTTHPQLNGAAGCPSCGGATCDPSSQVCVNSPGNPTCVPWCPQVGQSCGANASSTGGWCALVKNPSGVAQSACVPCGTTACAVPTSVCMIYGNGTYDTWDAATNRAACTCPTVASGWYSVGMSGCGDGTGVNGTSLDVDPANGRGPSVALDDLGVPYVAFTDTNPAAQVLAWDPALIPPAWNTAGPTSTVSAGGTAAQQPAIAFVSGGSAAPGLRVVWSELNTSGRRQIYLVRLEPTSRLWKSEALNGSGAYSNTGDGVSDLPNNDATLPALSLHPSGKHVVVWQDMQSNQIYASQLVSNWTALVAASSFITSASAFASARVAIPSNGPIPYVTFESGPVPFVSLAQYSGTIWKALDSSAESPGLSASTSYPAVHPDVAISSASNEPVVVWQYGIGTGAQIRIRQHDVTNVWKGFGSDVDFSQVSAGGQVPAAPALAMIGGTNPVVAYETGVATAARIVVRRWDGSAWSALGDSMATSGISDPNNEAHSPGIVVGPSPHDPTKPAVCVAWAQMNSGHVRPYLRCFDL